MPNFRVYQLASLTLFALVACNSGTTPGDSSSTPSVSLSATPTDVTFGGSILLTWSSVNTTSCTASNSVSNNDWRGNKSASAASANATLGNLTATGTYTLTCSGSSGSASKSVTITVNPPTLPSVSLSASPTTVLSGASSTLTWYSTNVTSCTASGDWTGSKGVSGQLSTGALNATKSYTLTCTGINGSTSKSTVVSLGVPLPVAYITSLDVVNTSNTNQLNVPLTFGHAFKAGDVPAGKVLAATLNDGTSIPLQLDAKATHADGSLRHAVVTVAVPTLAAGAIQNVRLVSAGASSGTAVKLADLLATSFDAIASLNLNGKSYTASAKNLLQTTTPKAWLSGPLVSEWIVGGPVKQADGTPHAHLTAYFHVRAYAGLGRIRVDMVIENNWTMVPSPQDFTYDVTLAVAGATAFSQAGLIHYQHARWHKLAWWGSDPQLYAKLDTIYLQDSKAIPKYESLTPSVAFLNSVRQSTEPMTNGDHTAYMDATGGQDGIAILPRWDAVYAVSGEQRAFNYMQANSDGGAAYSVHYRDEITGYPISIDQHPNADLGGGSGADTIPRGTTSTPYEESATSSHQPSIAYLSYLVTGDYFYLEEMQFWSAYSLAYTASYARHGEYGYPGDGSTGIFWNGSLRGQAWAYRSVAQAAAITPDTHALKSYFNNKLLNNLAYDTFLYGPSGVSVDKTILGTMVNSWLNTEYRAWQDDFFTGVMGVLVDLGYTQAVPLLNYKVLNVIGRMGEDPTHAFCFQFGPAYQMTMGPTDTTFYSSWAEVYDAQLRNLAHTPTQTPDTGACGSPAMAAWMTTTLGSTYVQYQETGYSDAPDGYYSQMQPALAAAVQSGASGAAAAWAKSRLSAVKPDYANAPQWAIIPRVNSGTP